MVIVYRLGYERAVVEWSLYIRKNVGVEIKLAYGTGVSHTHASESRPRTSALTEAVRHVIC